jgi:tRNA dimethylallyltransferase
MKKPIVIVICGPTASGKTALSIELAERINGEIVSADSMQIYKDMNIGSAKVTPEEMKDIKHYLIDCVSPDERYSVANYKRDAKNAIDRIIKKGKTPIVVGGTGLYIDALIYEIEYKDIQVNKEYRAKLKKISEEQGLEVLYKKALDIDPEAMKKISSNDYKRITRILEIYEATGKNKTEQEKESRLNEIPYDYRVFAINYDREKLYERINKRVDIMLNNGLINEVENLLAKYKNFPTAMQGLGYKEVKQYLDGEISKNEMVDKIKQESRRYAKRQFTWFRKNKQTIWIDGQADVEENIKKILEEISIE